MRVKFWLSNIIKSIIDSNLIRPNRFARRRWQKRCRATSITLLTTIAMIPLVGESLSGQCSKPNFSVQCFAAGRFTLSIATGDFNGDGMTDLATANFYSDDVSVLLGNGDGTFANQHMLPAGDRPSYIATGNFNGDGMTDLATANFYSDDVSVLLGNGDGTFAKQQRFAAGVNPCFVTTGDFNGDDVIDLATANRFPGDVSVLLNQCAPVLLGDVNLDGMVSLLDVQPFVDLLASGEYQAEADINQDGVVSLLDVDPFVAILAGG